jgi:hypothetical protein
MDVMLVPFHLGNEGLKSGNDVTPGQSCSPGVPRMLLSMVSRGRAVSKKRGKGGNYVDAPENLEDFVNLGIAREQGLARAHLGEDAADGPHVDACRVLATAEQDFGRAIPQGDDLVRVGAQGHAKGAGETKIGELEIAVLVDEEVLWLEIAMQDAVGVAVAHALAQLHHELLDHGVVHGQRLARQA